MSSERRREVRYPLEVPITLVAAGVVQRLTTKDVSYSGLFARTDSPPTVRQLTRLQIEMPESGALFETHAMTVFVIEPGDHAESGCGLKFYAMSEANRRVWNRFVDRLRAQPAPSPAPRQRRQVRFKTRISLRPDTLDALERLCQRALSTGAVQASVGRPAAVGAPLRLDVVHPTSGAVFRLDGVVRQIVAEPLAVEPDVVAADVVATDVVEIELADFGDDRRAAFVEFIGQ